jgi:Tol biopolymer transport system component
MADHTDLRRGMVAAGIASVVLAGCGGGSERPSSAARESGPEGRILFSQTVGEHSDLYTIRSDGGGLKRLTESTGEAKNADVSRDGMIVYEDDEATRAVIAVADADGRDRRVLTPSGFQGQPAWSPDGDRIVFERDSGPGDNGLWTMRPDGSDLRRLTRNPYAGAECGCDTDPAFSPDGQRISFVRIRSEASGRGALFVADRNGRNPRRITSWRLDPGIKHAWKPDGSQILLSSNAHPQPGESSNLYLLRPDGNGLRALTHFSGGTPNALAGSWSPDARLIAFKSDESGDYQIHLMNADGRDRRRLTDNLTEPSGIVWAR